MYCLIPLYLHLLKYALGVVAGQSSPDPAPLQVAYTPISVPTNEPDGLSCSVEALPNEIGLDLPCASMAEKT